MPIRERFLRPRRGDVPSKRAPHAVLVSMLRARTPTSRWHYGTTRDGLNPLINYRHRSQLSESVHEIGSNAIVDVLGEWCEAASTHAGRGKTRGACGSIRRPSRVIRLESQQEGHVLTWHGRCSPSAQVIRRDMPLLSPVILSIPAQAVTVRAVSVLGAAAVNPRAGACVNTRTGAVRSGG